jgi:chlorophyllide a reductase subunit Z
VHEELPWDEAAERAIDDARSSTPILTRISAAKELRDAAERTARRAGASRVAREHVAAIDLRSGTGPKNDSYAGRSRVE